MPNPIIRSAAIAGTRIAVRKSQHEQAYDRGFAAGEAAAMARDNVVLRVRQDGGLGGSKLALPTFPPAPPLSASSTKAELQAFGRWMIEREAVELDAIAELAGQALDDAMCHQASVATATDLRARAEAGVEVARAQLAVAQVEAAKADLAARQAPPAAPAR